MIRRSERSMYARHVFFTDFNDVDIFVEDTAIGSQKIYTEMLRRALGGNISIASIFPLGSKSVVIERCKADQGERKRRAIYIVDGDFENILRKEVPGLIRFYRLKRYCIENYLFDESAVVSVMNGEVVDKGIDEIGAALDFERWVTTVAEELEELLVASAVLSVKKCGVPNVRFGVADICGCETGYVERTKVQTKLSVMSTAVNNQYGTDVYETVAKEVRAGLFGDKVVSLKAFASGKNLLLPLLRRRLKHLFGFQGADAVLRLKLAMCCDVEELLDVSAVIA